MDKYIVKKVSKYLHGKYSQKLLDHLQQMHLKILQRQLFNKHTSDLIGNRIADRIKKVSKSSQQNNSERVTNEHDKEIPKKRYISLEKRQEIINDLRLK